MAFVKLCNLDDVWEGEMQAFQIEDHEILVVGLEGGEMKAYQGVCPHQDIALVEGKFDGKILICRAHQWVFDAATGIGLNPGDCRLATYPIQIVDNEVFINTEGVQPLFAHT
jgi:toluene monooxygenase system ferredoxin subunit